MIQLKILRNCNRNLHVNKDIIKSYGRKIFTVLLMTVFVCMMSSCGKKENKNADVDTNIVDNLSVDFLNVGKGDCAIIRMKKHTYMIDTGYEETAQSVITFLQNNKIKTIDGMIITHFDKDHVGGASQILNQFDVKKIYMPDYEGEGNKYKKFIEYLSNRNLNNIITRVTQDISIEAEGVKIDIYAPKMDTYSQENDYSLVTKIIHNKNSFLFAADAEATRLGELLGEPMLDSDVLKVPHHGKLEKNSIQFIDEVDPQYAIITCDTEGEVAASIIYEMENIGSEYYFNCNGNVRCISDGNGNISINQETNQ